MRYKVTSIALGAAASFFVAAPSMATQYQVSASGRIEGIASVRNGVVDQNPDLTGSLVKAGDAISYSFIFDSDTASLTSLFDADPTINIYNYQPKSVTLIMGSYKYIAGNASATGSSIQLWNNYQIGSSIVDSQSFSTFDYPSISKSVYPFLMGAGRVSESIDINLFDFTATARSSDLLTEIVDPSRFGSKLFSYGILNSSADLFYNVTSSNMAVSITAVPEPASWAMMIAGMGAIAGVLRRRQRHCPQVTFAA